MLQKMKMKLKEKKGFTLMEMLIVVAIIAILLAILIPTFGGTLEEARVRTDQANARAYYAEQMAVLMTGGTAEAFPIDDNDLEAAGASVVVRPAVLADATTENFGVTYNATRENSAITFGAPATTP